MNTHDLCLLVLNIRQFELTEITIQDRQMVLELESTVQQATCPRCGTESNRLHSRYKRYPTDLPWAQCSVFLELQVKRFFCHNAECPKRTFAEQFPDLVAQYARKTQHLRSLRMPTAVEIVGNLLTTATRETWPFETFLSELLEQEIEGRSQRRVERLQKSSHLPAGKTLAAFDQKKLPLRLTRQLAQLCSGEFVTRAENLLIFGLPGVGKTHFAAAVGHQLVQAGHSVLFTPTFHLVDELLRAKRDLLLESELHRLDTYEVLILDDIGYVQQSRDEMEVLFTLLAERYERRSVIITSNLVFSQWEQIFKDPMTTAAAIDRVVHHSIIVEFGKEIPSHRAQQAAQRIQPETPE